MDVKVHTVSYLIEPRRQSVIRQFVSFFLGKNHLDVNESNELLLLDHVSIHAKPGTVTALIGLGIGQKCLLECIALRQREGLMGGKISYDGSARNNGIFRDIVLINDLGITHFNSLTVFDYLYFGARIRLHHNVIECRERARQAARLVNLEGLRKISQLSRSELRILDIAVELVGNPTLICLIDPVEGLDASGKLEVLKVLSTVAKKISMTTTILFNCSSVNEDSIVYIDNVCMFSGNKLEYTLSFPKMKTQANYGLMVKHLLQLSLIILDYNKKFPVYVHEPNTEHFVAFLKIVDEMKALDATDQRSSEGSMGSFTENPMRRPSGNKAGANPLHLPTVSNSSVGPHQRYSLFEHKQMASIPREEFYAAHRRVGGNTSEGAPVRFYKSIYDEFMILAMRLFTHHRKNDVFLRLSFFRLMILSILLGGVCYSDGNDFDTVTYLVADEDGLMNSAAYNITSINFGMIVISTMIIGYFIPYLHANVKLLKFEVVSGLQRTISSWLSLILIDFPMILLAAFCVAIIFYEMLLIQGSFASYLGCFILTNLCIYSFAINCAIWCTTGAIAVTTYTFFMAFSCLISGYLQVLTHLPPTWYRISSFMFTRYGFEGLMITSFDDAIDKDNYLAYYDFNQENITQCLFYLGIWLILLQVGIVIGLLPPPNLLTIVNNNHSTSKTANSAATTSTAVSNPSLSLALQPGGNASLSPVLQQTSQFSVTNPTSADGGDVTWREYQSEEFFDQPSALDATITSFDGVNPSRSRNSEQPRTLSNAAGGNNYIPPGSKPNTSMPMYYASGASNQTTSSAFIVGSHCHPKMIPVPKHTMTTLSFTRIKYFPDKTGEDLSYSEPLLNGITGVVEPGTCACIIDGNDDSSSLVMLQVLAGIQQHIVGKITGVISANGQRLSKENHYYNIGYVPRGDITSVSSLTVREVLRYAALLRCRDAQPFLPWHKWDSATVANTSASQYARKKRPQKKQKKTENVKVEDSYYAMEEDKPKDIFQVNKEKSSQSQEAPLPPIGTTADIEERVNEVLAILGLEDVADYVVGKIADERYFEQTSNDREYFEVHRTKSLSVGRVLWTTYYQKLKNYLQEHFINTRKNNKATNNRLLGISPGQLRLLSIGMELINRPGLIVLEDPFYGLEWHDAERVAMVIKSLAKGNRTILCNISKPSWQLVSYFQEMFLLGSGLLLYSGQVSTAAEYFDNIGFKRSFETQNPLEYLLDIATDRGKMSMTNSDGKKLAGGMSQLSPEDLADLNRSLMTIRASKQKSLLSSASFTNPMGQPSPIAITTLTSNHPAHFAAVSGFSRNVSENEEGANDGTKSHTISKDTTLGSGSSFVGQLLSESYSSAPNETQDLVTEIHSMPSNGGGNQPVAQQRRPSAVIGTDDTNPLHQQQRRFSRTPSTTAGVGVGGPAALRRPSYAVDSAVIPTLPGPAGLSHMENSMEQVGKEYQKNVAVTNQQQLTPMGPIAIALLQRGYQLLWNDRAAVFWYLFKCFLAGILLGTVYYNLTDGDYLGRMSCFASIYIVLSVFIVDSLEGVYRRKEIFLRESSVHASNFLAYYLVDSNPTQLLYSVGSLITVGIAYPMAGLRPGFDRFIYFYLIVIASVYCNYAVAYALSICLNSLSLCKTVFTGIIIPLQFLMSGYLILISTMDSWNQWGAYICPMSYYLAGAMRNEFEDYQDALTTQEYTSDIASGTPPPLDTVSTVTYDDLSNHYEFHTDLVSVVFILIMMGIVYRTIWLFVLRVSVLFQQRMVQRKIIGMRRYTKRIVTATLRWRDEWIVNNGMSSGGNGDDDESMGGGTRGEFEFPSTTTPYQSF